MTFFSDTLVIEKFPLFSTTHITLLLVITIIIATLLIILKKFNSSKINKFFTLSLAFLILALEISSYIWKISADKWSLAGSLPLHICGISAYLSVIMLLIPSKYTLFEITYFWGLGGATMALLTPNLNHPFYHFMFFKFFITHSLIITAVLYMIVIEGKRPSHKSVLRTFVITNIYMLIIGMINKALDANYLYICHKPGNTTLLDYMGPWPYYIIAMEFSALLIFYLLYIPFSIKSTIQKVSGK